MTDAERLKRYDDLLSDYFPPAFKDWHENSRDEWPEITVMALRGRDKEIECCERQIRRQSDTIRDLSERIRAAHNLIASVYRPEWTREHEALEQAKAILSPATDKPAIGGEGEK
jgi:hypothetical protein